MEIWRILAFLGYKLLKELGKGNSDNSEENEDIQNLRRLKFLLENDLENDNDSKMGYSSKNHDNDATVDHHNAEHNVDDSNHDGGHDNDNDMDANNGGNDDGGDWSDGGDLY